jgi:hypothetical protein
MQIEHQKIFKVSAICITQQESNRTRIGSQDMTDPRQYKTYPLEEAVRAQKALRELAVLGPETFPIQAFVGMISDEIESLRNQGRSDEDIARAIQAHSAISITAAGIFAYYSPSAERHPARG